MADPKSLDISAIIEGTTNTIQGIAAGAVSLQGNASAQEKISNQQADLYTTIGTNQIVVDAARQNAELAVQNTKLRGAAAMGTDINAVGELMSGLTEESRAQAATQQEALHRIQQKQSVSFFDDPLSWIVNQFTVNNDIQEYNTAEEGFNQAQHKIQSLNQSTQSENLTATQLATPITAASIEASANVLKGQADLNANKARIDGLTYNSQGVRDALTADKDIQAQRLSVFGAEKAQEQTEMALAHLDLARQKFNWETDQKAKGEAAEKYYIDQINKGGEILRGTGYVPIPVGSPKAGMVLNMLKSGSPQGKEYEEYFQAAERTQSLGFVSKSTSPAHTAQLIQSGSLKLSEAQEPIKGLLSQAASAVDLAIKSGSVDPKNKGAIEASMNANVKAIMEQQAKNIVPGDRDNVYNIPSMKSLIESSPTLQKLPLVQKLLGPQVASNIDLSDPNKLFATVVAGVKAGTISYNDALDVSKLYRTGVDVNLAAKQFTGLGLVPVATYNTKVQTNPYSPFDGRETVDFTNQVSVARALNKTFAIDANKLHAEANIFGSN
jgi:hypothetical protein